MKTVKSKSLIFLHTILGVFFTMSGILTIGNKHYIFNTWLISLGLSFLIDPFKLFFLTKVNPQSLKIFTYALYAIVVISGIIVFTMEFNIG